MDINSARAQVAKEDEGVLIPVKDAAGRPEIENGKPVTIRVVGSYSKTYRRATDEIKNKALEARRLNQSIEETTSDAGELIASCVLAWEGFTADGAPFPCTKENALVLFEAAPWIQGQVAAAVYDHAGFFPKASEPSPSS